MELNHFLPDVNLKLVFGSCDLPLFLVASCCWPLTYLIFFSGFFLSLPVAFSIIFCSLLWFLFHVFFIWLLKMESSSVVIVMQLIDWDLIGGGLAITVPPGERISISLWSSMFGCSCSYPSAIVLTSFGFLYSVFNFLVGLPNGC